MIQIPNGFYGAFNPIVYKSDEYPPGQGTANISVSMAGKIVSFRRSPQEFRYFIDFSSIVQRLFPNRFAVDYSQIKPSDLCQRVTVGGLPTAGGVVQPFSFYVLYAAYQFGEQVTDAGFLTENPEPEATTGLPFTLTFQTLLDGKVEITVEKVNINKKPITSSVLALVPFDYSLLVQEGRLYYVPEDLNSQPPVDSEEKYTIEAVFQSGATNIPIEIPYVENGGLTVTLRFVDEDLERQIHLPVNPCRKDIFYIRWINRLGGYRYAALQKRQESYTYKRGELIPEWPDTVLFDDSGLPLRRDYNLGGEARATVIAGRQGIPLAMWRELAGMTQSPNVELYAGDGLTNRWIAVKPTSSPVFTDTRKESVDFECTFELPQLFNQES